MNVLLFKLNNVIVYSDLILDHWGTSEIIYIQLFKYTVALVLKAYVL